MFAELSPTRFGSITARRLLAGLAVVVLFSACAPVARLDSSPTAVQTPIKDETTLVATSRITPSLTPSPSASPTPLPPVVGPDYLPGFNPLTGQPVNDPASVNQAPFLVSVTNFPLSARPQSGLSLASIVWEVSIGQGMSRFLAVFYGDYLTELEKILEENPTDNPYGYVISPIRSGRVVYEDIKVLFPDATLITRGASPEVLSQLTNRVGVLPVNSDDVNSAGLTMEDLLTLPSSPLILRNMPAWSSRWTFQEEAYRLTSWASSTTALTRWAGSIRLSRKFICAHKILWMTREFWFPRSTA